MCFPQLLLKPVLYSDLIRVFLKLKKQTWLSADIMNLIDQKLDALESEFLKSHDSVSIKISGGGLKACVSGLFVLHINTISC